jgi:hypothetical protein
MCLKEMYVSTAFSPTSIVDMMPQEYDRKKVDVHPLGSLTSLAESSVFEELSSNPSKVAPLPDIAGLPPAIQAETYVYSASVSYLNAELWSFDEFVQKNAWKWIANGRGSRSNSEYIEVDEMWRVLKDNENGTNKFI